VDGWRRGPHSRLDPATEKVLGADDYLSVYLSQSGQTAPVELFLAWYKSQDNGGVHSPEICLPGGGWEIAKLEQIASPVKSPDGAEFTLNRAIIQKGTSRMLVYYWYEQRGIRTSSMYQAKLQLMIGKLLYGRNDSAIVRLITPIEKDGGEVGAEMRLHDGLAAILEPLPRFIPGI
jgi:EpsI family protein